MSLFFFSSRRRHTRLQGDWSSDVCSSDLSEEKVVNDARLRVGRGHVVLPLDLDVGDGEQARAVRQPLQRARATFRSEERRVGKECRSRATAYYQKQGERKDYHEIS